MANTDKIQSLLISEIEINPLWNTRSNVEDSTGGPETTPDGAKSGFAGLVVSMREKGQDSPIVVRPSKGKKPFSLVAGFRRVAALLKIAEEAKNKAPSVNAVVRELSDVEARELNVRENTEREDLGGADLCFGVGGMVHAYKSANMKYTQQTIADAIGMSQGYVGKLIKISEFVNIPIQKAWREAPQKITVDEMHKVACVPTGEQQKLYNELSRGKEVVNEDGDPKKGKNAWITTAKKNAVTIGTMLGTLARDGGISAEDGEFAYEHLDTLVKVNAKATDTQRTAIAKTLEKAFNAALVAEVVKVEDETKGKGRAKGEARAEN